MRGEGARGGGGGVSGGEEEEDGDHAFFNINDTPVSGDHLAKGDTSATRTGT